MEWSKFVERVDAIRKSEVAEAKERVRIEFSQTREILAKLKSGKSPDEIPSEVKEIEKAISLEEDLEMDRTEDAINIKYRSAYSRMFGFDFVPADVCHKAMELVQCSLLTDGKRFGGPADEELAQGGEADESEAGQPSVPASISEEDEDSEHDPQPETEGGSGDEGDEPGEDSCESEDDEDDEDGDSDESEGSDAQDEQAVAAEHSGRKPGRPRTELTMSEKVLILGAVDGARKGGAGFKSICESAALTESKQHRALVRWLEELENCGAIRKQGAYRSKVFFPGGPVFDKVYGALREMNKQ